MALNLTLKNIVRNWKSSSCLLLLLLLVELSDVEAFVDVPGDGLDLCAQLLLDPVQSKSVVIGDQVDCDSEMTKSAASSDPVKVGLGHLREVEVDDDVDGLDVDTSGEEIATDQVPAEAGSEVVEDSIAVSLSHLGVDVVAGVPKLGDLLRQQLHSLCRVAEDDALEEKEEIKIAQFVDRSK